MFSKFSVKKPYTIVVSVVLIAILGFVSFTSMTVDLLPDMDLPYAIVFTQYQGANPETVETVVTRPIEQSMATVSNISEITSTSQDSSSMVMLEFNETTNMDSASIEIRESLDMISGYWPDEVSNPMIMKINPNMMPIMVAAIAVEGNDTAENSEYISNEILPRLESLGGVASVTTMGVVEQSVEVTVNQEKLNVTNSKVQVALDGTFAEAQEEIDSAKRELESGSSQLDSAAQELSEQKTEVTEALRMIEEQEAEMNAGYEVALQTAIAQAEAAVNEQFIGMIAQMIESVGAENPGFSDIESALAYLETLEGTIAAIDIQQLMEQYQAALEAAVSGATNAVNSQFDPLKSQLAEGKSQLEQGATALDAAAITASIEIAAGKAGITSAQAELEQGQTQLEESKEAAKEGADVNELITASMVNQLLTAQNFNMPAGYVNEEGIDYLVRVGDKFADIEELKSMPLFDLGIEGLEPILLSDVADVNYASNESDTYAKLDGSPAVMIQVQKQTGYSTGDVSQRMLTEFEEIEAENDNTNVVTLMDQGVYIDMIINSVMSNMVYGGILAILILLIFLRSIRSTFVIACSIPISVVAALVMMYFSNITLNIISLSGLALGIGMLVDNSIVVIENIHRMRMEEGLSSKKAAIMGAQQVAGAIMASTLTTVCVFLPIVFTQGITRQLFVDMGLTIAYSLLASLVVALTVVPMLSSVVLKKEKREESKFFHKIQDFYAAVLKKALRLKAVVFILSLVLLGASFWLAYQNGLAFIPAMESTQITVSLRTDDKSTLEETSEEADKLAEHLATIKDIDSVGAMMTTDMLTGQSTATNSVDFYINLAPEREMNDSQLKEAIETGATDVNGEVVANMSTMDISALGGTGLAIEIKGNDLDTLQSVAKDVGEIVTSVEGTTEVSNGMEDATDELRVVVDKVKAAKENLTVAQVFQEINAKLALTSSMSSLSTDGEEYSIDVVDGNQETYTREDIKDVTITAKNTQGEEKEVLLSDIATFEDAVSPQAIQHKSQSRIMTVTGMVEDDYNISQVAAEVSEKLEEYDLPNGYSIEMAGEDESIMESMYDMMQMLGLAVVFMYLIMVAQFQSLRSPFIIMFTVPLAFTGGLLGLWITGAEISIIAMIGFVMLSGIIVNNGIVLVDYTNQLIEQGISQKEALVKAGITRLRPIIMTALTTILGLSTMALGIGMGSDMVQPMAVVTIGGLIYGTVLTLFIVPCVYDLFHNREKHRLIVNDEEEGTIEE